MCCRCSSVDLGVTTKGLSRSDSVEFVSDPLRLNSVHTNEIDDRMRSDVLQRATPPGTRMTPKTPMAPTNPITFGVHDPRHDARIRAAMRGSRPACYRSGWGDLRCWRLSLWNMPAATGPVRPCRLLSQPIGGTSASVQT